MYSSRNTVCSACCYFARELCDAAPGVSSTLRREDAKRLMMNYLSVHMKTCFTLDEPNPRRVHHQAFLPRGTEARASSKIHFAFLSLTSDTLRPPLAMSFVHLPPVVVVVGPARGRPVSSVIVAAIVPAAPIVVPVPPVVPVSGPFPPVVSPVAAPVPAAVAVPVPVPVAIPVPVPPVVPSVPAPVVAAIVPARIPVTTIPVIAA